MKEQVLKQSQVFWKGLEQADTAAMRSHWPLEKSNPPYTKLYVSSSFILMLVGTEYLLTDVYDLNSNG